MAEASSRRRRRKKRGRRRVHLKYFFICFLPVVLLIYCSLLLEKKSRRNTGLVYLSISFSCHSFNFNLFFNRGWFLYFLVHKRNPRKTPYVSMVFYVHFYIIGTRPHYNWQRRLIYLALGWFSWKLYVDYHPSWKIRKQKMETSTLWNGYDN